MNAIDAGGSKEVPTLTVEGPGTVVLEDRGNGKLCLESFVMGRSIGNAKKVGQFGVGLKDAVAVFMRNGAKVSISSSVGGDFDFKVAKGDFECETIHVKNTQPSTSTPLARSSSSGTCITITGLQTPRKLVESVKKNFLCFSPKRTLIIKTESVEVFKPLFDNKGKLYVNGIELAPPQPLFFSYNLTGSPALRESYDRDHNIKGNAFKKDVRPHIENALRKMARHAPYLPPKPKHEFNWKDVRVHFFPEPAVAHPLRQRSLVSCGITSSQNTSFSRSFSMMKTEQPDLTDWKMKYDTLHEKYKQLEAEHKKLKDEHKKLEDKYEPTTRQINELIDKYSREDSVPIEHKRCVDELANALKKSSDFNVAEVFVGGSYAKGTSIGKHSDVDMVVVLNNIPSDDHQYWLLSMLASLKERVDFPRTCVVQNTTRFALHLRFENVDIDLLPVPAEAWNHPKASMEKASTPFDRQSLSVAFSSSQVKYVKDNKGSAGVTGIIRLIKRWVKQHDWQDFKSKPKSYIIELLVIRAREMIRSEDKMELLKTFWKSVRDYKQLNFKPCPPHKVIEHHRPLVVDPANSMNNVAASFHWEEFSRCATDILDTQLKSFVEGISN
eukprot:m.84490 g.84490  ORF g.84490 m.84490 type:complete len:610 (+) comp12158_c0_seq1:172-2001(+)